MEFPEVVVATPQVACGLPRWLVVAGPLDKVVLAAVTGFSVVEDLLEGVLLLFLEAVGPYYLAAVVDPDVPFGGFLAGDARFRVPSADEGDVEGVVYLHVGG